MRRNLVFATMAVLFGSAILEGMTPGRDPSPAIPGGAPCPCRNYADVYSSTKTMIVPGPPEWPGSQATVQGHISIYDTSYCPSKQKLNFTVLVNYTQSGGCTSQFLGASGQIGPFSFNMSSTSLVINGFAFPVTSGGGSWSAIGALTGVTEFDCSTWYVQANYVEGICCLPWGTWQFLLDTEAAEYFGCTCQ